MEKDREEAVEIRLQAMIATLDSSQQYRQRCMHIYRQRYFIVLGATVRDDHDALSLERVSMDWVDSSSHGGQESDGGQGPCSNRLQQIAAPT